MNTTNNRMRNRVDYLVKFNFLTIVLREYYLFLTICNGFILAFSPSDRMIFVNQKLCFRVFESKQ